MTKIISNNRAFNLDTPTKAGTYSVLYRRAKSYEKNVGTAKFTKKRGWEKLIGKSGKALEATFNNPEAAYARATPVIIGWSE